MTIENVPLPFEKVRPEELTGQQLIDAVVEGVDPNSGLIDDAFNDSLRDDVYYGYRDAETPIGTFTTVAEWSGGDGHPMGKVVKHLESGIYLLLEGTYSSWDGSEYESIVVAEPYQFVETRYRAV